MQFIKTFWQTYTILKRHTIEKVVTTGGTIALPVCLAAALQKKVIDLYELNAVPGKAIRLLAPIARTVFVCFPEAMHYFKKKPCILTNYPLQLSLSNKPDNPQTARRSLGLDPNCITVVILGGSQGSVFINNVMERWLSTNRKNTPQFQVIHQTGSVDPTDWQAVYAKHNILAHVFPYSHAMHTIYSAADIIICRSGAGSLFEAVHYKKICITIPLEGHAGGHQLTNAQAMERQYPELIHIIRQHTIVADIASFSTALEHGFDTIISKHQNSVL